MDILTSQEISTIKLLRAKNESLSIELKSKLLKWIKSGKPSIFDDDHDDLCCDLGLGPSERYQWTTFENCKAMGGQAADNSACGH